MDHFDVESALRTMVILCDTREKPTERAKARYRRMGIPVIQQKLDYGDYSAKCDALDLSHIVAVERKQDLSELSMCFCQERDRFRREFERAKEDGAKIYLLIENASIDAIYWHHYKTKMAPKAMIASLFAWMARYNCTVLFCDEISSGQIIKEILYREMKERLEKIDAEKLPIADKG